MPRLHKEVPTQTLKKRQTLRGTSLLNRVDGVGSVSSMGQILEWVAWVEWVHKILASVTCVVWVEILAWVAWVECVPGVLLKRCY